MIRRAQLYKFSRHGFRMVSLVVDERVTLKDASTAPAVYWPDGRWCTDVNLYLNDLWDKGLKFRPKGGTLGTYAAYLTPLIRYVFERRGADFKRLTNGDFIECISQVVKEKLVTKVGTTARRSSTTVNEISHVWLNFLAFLAKTYDWANFLGEHGAIRAKKNVRIVGEGVLAHEESTWTHIAIPNRDVKNRRFPITERVVASLRSAASKGRSIFLRRRRLAMIELFDILGFRRIEASLLRVRDVRDAIAAMHSRRVQQPLEVATGLRELHANILSFRMRKQHDGNQERLRHVPVSAASLQYLNEYLDLRERFIRRNGLSESKTEGCFFFNLRTGMPLEPNTFTQEIWSIAQDFNKYSKTEAKIVFPCSPHMMRARYITREFVRLVMSHKMENPDDFRRALIDIEHLKKEVALITGHRDVKSLDFYIDLAFAEVGDLAQTKARVDAQRDIDAMVRAAERYKLSISEGEDATSAGMALVRQIEALAKGPPPAAPTHH